MGKGARHGEEEGDSDVNSPFPGAVSVGGVGGTRHQLEQHLQQRRGFHRAHLFEVRALTSLTVFTRTLNLALLIALSPALEL